VRKASQILLGCICLAFILAQPVQAEPRWIEETLSTNLSYIMRDNERDVIYLADAEKQELVLLDTMTEEIIERLSIPSSNFADMAMSKDNKTLAIGGGSVVLVDVETLDIKELSIAEDVVSVAFDYKGNLYFTTTEYWGKIHYYDLATETVMHSFAAHNSIYKNALVKTDKEGKILYAAERGLSPASLYKFDVSGEEPIFRAEDAHGALGGNLRDFAISPDGKKIYIACGAPYGIQVVDSESIERIALLETGAYPGGVDLDKYGIYVYGIPLSTYNNILYQFKTADLSLTNSFPLLKHTYNGAPGVRGIAVDKTGEKAFIIHGDSHPSYLTFKVQVVDTEVNICEEAIALLEEEIATLKAKVTELEELIANILSQNEQLTNENSSLRQDISNMAQTIADLREENATVKAELDALKAKIKNLPAGVYKKYFD